VSKKLPLLLLLHIVQAQYCHKLPGMQGVHPSILNARKDKHQCDGDQGHIARHGFPQVRSLLQDDPAGGLRTSDGRSCQGFDVDSYPNVSGQDRKGVTTGNNDKCNVQHLLHRTCIRARLASICSVIATSHGGYQAQSSQACRVVALWESTGPNGTMLR
jgi:hypothetical protein